MNPRPEPSPQILQLAALKDNSIYMWRPSQNTPALYVVDPTLAAPVLDICHAQQLQVEGILVTHHHPDHIGGIEALTAKFSCPVWGYEKDRHRIPQITRPLPEQGEMALANFPIHYFATPGHTLGHICYYLPMQKALFCGDTLFSFGCGRLFEGTPEQMVHSLSQIRALPSDTFFYCSHEYTQINLEFALSLEPNNEKLKNKYQEVLQKRAQHKSTLPDLLGEQKELNPFLRWDDLSFKKHMGLEDHSDIEFFAALRKMRNRF